MVPTDDYRNRRMARHPRHRPHAEGTRAVGADTCGARSLDRRAVAYGRGCTSTLGGLGDGSWRSARSERRTMLNATAPPARTATAAPASTQGRLPRRWE